MSALARYFQNIGKNVSGYDKTPTMLTDELIAGGMNIHFEDSIAAIPADYFVENTLVIVTPAVPVSHSEWNYFFERDYVIKKRAEVLGLITKDTFCFAVAGTHGKTTTSSILGHILYESGADVTAFLGGIVENYHSNLIGSGKTITVVEADEFDRSFLHLHPNIACVTSMDADHLDIYGDRVQIEDGFRQFAGLVPNDNQLFVRKGIAIGREHKTYAVNEEADYYSDNLRMDHDKIYFDFHTPTQEIKDFVWEIPGIHNVENATVALAILSNLGVDFDTLKKAIANSLKELDPKVNKRIKLLFKEKQTICLI